jgi:hypothetical protein
MNPTPLLDQIRVYSQALVEELPETPTARLEPSQPPTRERRGLVVAIVMAVVVLVVGLVPVLLFGNGHNTATQTTPTNEETLGMDGFEGEPVPLTIIDTELTPSVIGDIRWTVVKTNASVVPSGLVATAFGFGSISRDGSRLLVSDDAIEWLAVQSPITGWLPPQESEGRAFGASGVFGDEESGYAILTQREGGVIQDWHSTDFIDWDLVQPPDHNANTFSLYFGSTIQRDDTSEPTDAEPQIDPPPGFDGGSCDGNVRVTAGDPGTLVYINSNGLPCGELRHVDSGWVFGFGLDLQGGKITLWASADGENWEVVDSGDVLEFGNVGGNGGSGWDVSSAGNVIILTTSGPMPSTGPLDSTTPAWYWVIELP